MAAAIASVFVDLGANTARFMGDMKKAGTGLDGFAAKAKGAAGVARGALAGVGDGLKMSLAGLGVAGAFAAVKKAAGDMAELSLEAQRAGVAVEAFQELGYAAQGALVKMDALTDGLKEMQLRADEFIVTGAGGGAEAFQRLGYSADELKEKLADPSALFEEIIERLGRLDKASQIRVADELFGGTGGEQFVRLLDQGNGYIARMRQEARDTGNVLDEALVQRAVEIDRQFAKISTTIGTNLKGALVGVVALMRDFSDMLNSTENQSNATLQRRIDLINAAVENAKKSSFAFGAIGGEAGIASRLAERDQLQAQLDGRPPRITVNKPPGGRGDLSNIDNPAKKAADDLAKAYANIVQNAEARIAQLAVEQQALGLTTAEAEALRVKTDLLNELQRAGIAITSDYAAKVDELAQRSGEAAAALEAQAKAQAKAQADLADSMDTVRGTSYDVIGGFVSDLRNGVSATDALNNALNRVLDTVIQISLQKAITGLLGAPGTTQTGSIGGMLGFSGGGYTGPGGKYQPAGVVHKGEVVWSQDDVRRAGGVSTVEAMRRGLAGYASGGAVSAPRMPRIPSAESLRPRGGGVSVSYTAPNVSIGAGASPESVAELRRVLEDDRRNFEARTVRAIQNAQRRNIRI